MTKTETHRADLATCDRAYGIVAALIGCFGAYKLLAVAEPSAWITAFGVFAVVHAVYAVIWALMAERRRRRHAVPTTGYPPPLDW